MDKREQAVVSIVGRDDVGILAQAAACIAKENASVREVTQSVTDGFFTMMMLIDVSNLRGTILSLQESLTRALPDMKCYVMHENIFDAMHRI